MQHAILLVAGLGSRLHSVSQNEYPKGALQIEGKSLVERSLENLIEVGVRSILLVTGHMADYYDNLAKKMSLAHNISIETVKNPLYAISGSMASFFCAKEWIQKNVKETSFLLLEGDLIYEKKGLEVLIQSIYETALLLSEDKKYGDDYYFELSETNTIKRLKNDASQFSCYGELTGINKISTEDYLELCNIFLDLREIFINYENALALLAQKKSISAEIFKGFLWAEIDDESHFNFVTQQLLPRLKLA